MKIINYCVCCNSKKLDVTPAVIMPFIMKRIFDWDIEEINESWNLKSVNNTLLYQRTDSLQCKKCGHLFSSVRFSKKEMNNLYSNYRDDEYVKTREKYEPGYSLVNEELKKGYSYKNIVEDFLEKYLSKQRTILDFGGDSGINTPFVNDKNSEVFIYDISNNKTIKGVKPLEKKELNNHSYDLISCSQVLEHLSFPKKLVKEIRKVGDKDTVFYFEVPLENIIKDENKKAYLNKKHWHEHINFYTKESLSSLLKLNDFKIIEMKTFKTKICKKEFHILGAACMLS